MLNKIKQNKMEDYILSGFIANVQRAVEEGCLEKTNTIGIEMLNLENFKFKLKNKSGIVSISELIELRELIDGVIKKNSYVVHNIIRYDEESPNYWGKNLMNDFDDRIIYNVSIDLEGFVDEESHEHAIAEKLLKEFEEAGNSIDGINDNHYPESANWEVNDKVQAINLVKYIQDNYVTPKLKEWKEYAGIEKVIWLEDKVDFVFKK